MQTDTPQVDSQNNSKKHGGARPGSGRPKKSLKYASEVAASEARIITALPSLIDGLISAALGGDVKASCYLIDRVLGRIPEASACVAESFTESPRPALELVTESDEQRMARLIQEEDEWQAKLLAQEAAETQIG